MEATRSGRFVAVAQWVMAVLLPAFFFIGRGLVGADLGWLTVLSVIYGPIVIVLMLIPPLVTRLDRDVRELRCVRQPYVVASWALWVSILVASLTVPDAADGGPFDTALTAWTGGRIDDQASAAVFAVAGIGALIAYAAQLAFAVSGALRSRKAPAAV
jgi:hypothetical protein